MDLEFKPVSSDSIETMIPFYGLRPNRTCDSVFLESFIWKDFYQVRYAIWENKALLWLMEYHGEVFSAMPLCREEDLPEAFQAIERYFNEKLGLPLVIYLADEAAVECLQLPEKEYLVQEQEDGRDYLYNGDSMRTLAGKKMHKKKNRVNAFKREYEGRYEYRRLTCADRQDVWEFLDRWRETKGEDVEEHLDYEVLGIHDILRNCSRLPICMGGIYLDGHLEAFTIGSFNRIEQMAVIHIEKANPEINGLYQYINQQFLLEEFPEAEWINREDDLGLEGLRKAKMSYNPADFARKYLVRQKRELSGDEREIRSLSDAEKQATEPLYHECFPEDSRSFREYYYTEKVKNNRILALRSGGEWVSMIQRNPYRMLFGGREWELDYLVAVATREDCRRRGLFRHLMVRLLEDQRKEGKPFTYLVPVNEAVYRPFGFTWIGSLPEWELTEDAKELLETQVCTDTQEDCAAAAEYMESWLDANAGLHTKRDAAYVSGLLKELASENGQLVFLKRDGTTVGLQADWGIEKREQRLLYADGAYTKKTGEKPWNMGRVTHLETFLAAFSRREDCREDLVLGIRMEDTLIPEQNGEFLWKVGESVVRAGWQETKEAAFWLEADSERLMSWLMGRETPENLWPGLSEEELRLLNQVEPIRGVLLDEIV